MNAVTSQTGPVARSHKNSALNGARILVVSGGVPDCGKTTFCRNLAWAGDLYLIGVGVGKKSNDGENLYVDTDDDEAWIHTVIGAVGYEAGFVLEIGGEVFNDFVRMIQVSTDGPEFFRAFDSVLFMVEPGHKAIAFQPGIDALIEAGVPPKKMGMLINKLTAGDLDHPDLMEIVNYAPSIGMWRTQYEMPFAPVMQAQRGNGPSVLSLSEKLEKWDAELDASILAGESHESQVGRASLVCMATAARVVSELPIEKIITEICDEIKRTNQP
jgi:hypothetical protein